MNPKIKEYTVVSNNDYRVLAQEVTKKIGEGWQPLGGMVALNLIIPPPSGTAMRAPQILREFYQAMIKDE